MANTLKFGSGNWAAKKDSILAYNDENANFKPLPFTTSRASTATRINKAGLIEKVENGIPRVDYLGNTKGALKLEPQSTNKIQYSESFGQSYWAKSGATIQGDPSTAGVEKIVNGDFATDSNWSKGTGWSIGSGVASCDGSQAGLAYLNQSGNIVVGKMYKVTYDLITVSAGEVRAFCGGITGTARTTTGTYTEYQMAGTTAFWLRGSSTFVGSIDNVSVKEVSGFASPSSDSPLGAFKLNITTVNDYLLAQFSSYSAVVGQSITASIFAKNEITNFLAFGGATVVGTDVYSIQDYGNGWFRHIVTRTFTTTATGSVQWIVFGQVGSNTIFGAQFEQKSYATSYIPNYGESAGVTRLGETFRTSNSLILKATNQFTLFFEAKDFLNYGTSAAFITTMFVLGASTNPYDVGTGIHIYSGTWFYFDGTNAISLGVCYNSLTDSKIAISYDGTKFTTYANGVKIATLTVSASMVNWDSVDGGVLSYVSGGVTVARILNLADLQLYNNSLTDSEIQALTTI